MSDTTPPDPSSQRDVTAQESRYAISIDDKTADLLRDVAARLGVTMDVALEEAIKEYALNG